MTLRQSYGVLKQRCSSPVTEAVFGTKNDAWKQSMQCCTILYYLIDNMQFFWSCGQKLMVSNYNSSARGKKLEEIQTAKPF